MFALVAVALLQISAAVPEDSAIVVHDSVVVMPVGFSIALPPEWIGRAGPPGRRMCDEIDRGWVGSPKWLVTGDSLEAMHKSRAGWTRVMREATDSVIPLDALTIHLGSTHWSSSCQGPQIRIYVEDANSPSAVSKLQEAVHVIESKYRPVTRMTADSAEWNLVRLSWIAESWDYSPPHALEFWSRTVRNRRVTLVLMYAPVSEGWSTLPQRVVASAKFRDR